MPLKTARHRGISPMWGYVRLAFLFRLPSSEPHQSSFNRQSSMLAQGT
jgi:hypothetical protein